MPTGSARIDTVRGVEVHPSRVGNVGWRILGQNMSFDAPKRNGQKRNGKMWSSSDSKAWWGRRSSRPIIRRYCNPIVMYNKVGMVLYVEKFLSFGTFLVWTVSTCFAQENITSCCSCWAYLQCQGERNDLWKTVLTRKSCLRNSPRSRQEKKLMNIQFSLKLQLRRIKCHALTWHVPKTLPPLTLKPAQKRQHYHLYYC